MFIHPNYASNYASLTATRTQCLHCQVSGWQDMKAMPLTLFLPPSLPHIFGTIIPLFSSAVWSCFTPVHPHWLPFCPISPPLIRLCVISNDSQKMAVHIRAPHATSMPVIQFNTNTSLLYSQPSNQAIMYCFPAVSRVQCKSGGLLFTLTGAQCFTMVPCCMYAQPAKRGITQQRLWKGAMNKEIQSPTWTFIVSNHWK